MKSLFIALLTASALFLSGCATLQNLAGSERLDQVKLGLDIVYLDQEFEPVMEAIMAVDWTDADRTKVREHLARMQQMKDGLKALAKGKAEGLQHVVTPGASKAFLDEIAVHYNGIRNTYTAHVEATGIEPDPKLKAYAGSAVAVWVSMQRYVESGRGGIDVQTLEKLLSYVARGFLLYNTGGASAF